MKLVYQGHTESDRHLHVYVAPDGAATLVIDHQSVSREVHRLSPGEAFRLAVGLYAAMQP